MTKMPYTHLASIYGIPAYWDDRSGMLAGKNIVCDVLIIAATWFHNFFIERFAQLGAAITGQDYTPGFPLKIWEIEE